MRRMRIAPALCAAIMALPVSAAAQDTPAPARRAALTELLRQDCGSCHGMRLTGGLGPALTPAALADKPDDAMVATILGGRRGTPMPPWSRFMNAGEARWLVTTLREGGFDAH